MQKITHRKMTTPDVIVMRNLSKQKCQKTYGSAVDEGKTVAIGSEIATAQTQIFKFILTPKS